MELEGSIKFPVQNVSVNVIPLRDGTCVVMVPGVAIHLIQINQAKIIQSWVFTGSLAMLCNGNIFVSLKKEFIYLTISSKTKIQEQWSWDITKKETIDFMADQGTIAKSNLWNVDKKSSSIAISSEDGSCFWAHLNRGKVSLWQMETSEETDTSDLKEAKVNILKEHIFPVQNTLGNTCAAIVCLIDKSKNIDLTFFQVVDQQLKICWKTRVDLSGKLPLVCTFHVTKSLISIICEEGKLHTFSIKKGHAQRISKITLPFSVSPTLQNIAMITLESGYLGILSEKTNAPFFIVWDVVLGRSVLERKMNIQQDEGDHLNFPMLSKISKNVVAAVWNGFVEFLNIELKYPTLLDAIKCGNKSSVISVSTENQSYCLLANSKSIQELEKNYFDLVDVHSDKTEHFSGSKNAVDRNIAQIIIRKCLTFDEKKSDFFSHKIVQHMIETGSILSQDVTGGLIKTLLQLNQVELAFQALSIQDIPEADIVRLVSYICASDPENTRSRLSLILQYRYSDVFLTRALTSLKVEEVQYLVIILISMFEQIGEGFDLENDTLTESDLIQFIICLIDAQVSSLLLVPELHEPLQQLSKMVRSHVDACSSIETLRSIITDCHRESKKYHKGDMKSFGEFDSYTIDTINW